ncbi:MAG: exonuclease sbcCD subunit D, partial [bacterium]|nr:exonuclease sbcCD subunit D [bacterium]
IVGSTADVGSAIEIHDEHGVVVIYALPFLEPDVARYELGTTGEPLARSHEAVMAEALRLVANDIGARNRPRAVAVGHAFVSGGGADADITTASERDLSVGGVQVVHPRGFGGHGLQYVALGHLHRPHTVRESDPVIAYSGSLLRYSLSESGHEKSVVIAEIGAQGMPVTMERVELPRGRGMSRLAGLLDDLIGDRYAQHRDDFVELVVTDPMYPERMHARLDAVFPWALTKVHEPVDRPALNSGERGDARGRDPVDVMAQFFIKVTGRELTHGEAVVLRDVYESVRDS